MKRLLARLLCLALACEVCASEPTDFFTAGLFANGAKKADSAATIVIYNENDAESPGLAHYYAERRGIAADHLIGLHCSKAEEITRAEFDREIAQPLRQLFRERGWWKMRVADHALGPLEESEIRFVALIRGIPLRIGATAEPYPGDVAEGPAPISSRNDASVDSELAALGLFSRSISGSLQNPYFRSFTRIAEAHLPALLLVCRLDAPTAAIVRRMIDDSLQAERDGLRGFVYLDARGLTDSAYAEGDQWLNKIARNARRSGFPVLLDDSEAMFPPNYPMRNAALYFGWYAEQFNGPMACPGAFVSGAIAVHIHSFSAATLRDPHRFWCGPLLAAGAAATMGNVAEPYLTLTPHLDVFYERLQAGFTFAESAWSSERVLSWMTTFVGDPLYCPFAMQLDPPRPSDWTLLAEGTTRWNSDPEAGAALLRRSAEKLKSGTIMEGLALLQQEKDPASAAESFGLARHWYLQPADILRATLEEIGQLRILGKEADAQKLAAQQVRRFPQAPASELLRGLWKPE